MDEIKDPELPRQKKEHEQFKEKVNEVDLEALNDENGKEVLTELLEFLSRWLYHHILGSDTMIGKMPALDEEEDPFKYTERLPIALDKEDNLYVLEKFVYTNMDLDLNNFEQIYSCEGKNIAFF